MLGDQIKRLRLAKKWNQMQLAQRLEISKQCISNWENNNMVPSVEMLKKICHVFSCSSDFLLELDVEKPVKIDASGLTIEQALHVQQIVDDLVNVSSINQTTKVRDVI